jgi:hypothetical protein
MQCEAHLSVNNMARVEKFEVNATEFLKIKLPLDVTPR